MELRHLRYFVAVAEARSFRSAAGLLHVAQPAISRQIKALEGELGVSLFDRLSRGTTLTDMGRAFLADAKRILLEVDAAAERARRVAKGQVGKLRVAFNEVGLWHGVVPEAIRAFRAAHPDVELQLIPLDSPEQREALRDARIDAGFLYALPNDEPRLGRIPVQRDDMVLALRSTHRLAGSGTLSVHDLEGEPLIWTSRPVNPHVYDALTAAWLAAGVTPNVVQETTTGALVLSLVAVGMGLGLVTTAMRWRLPEGVLLKPISDLSVPLRLDLAWARSNLSPVLGRFAATTRAVVQAVAPDMLAGGKA